MKQKQKLGRFFILFLVTIGFCPLVGMAAVQVSENFDNTNWPFVTSSSSVTNFTNSVTGWAIDNGTIYKNTSGSASNFWTSPSNSCIISSARGLSAIRSPMCSNGVGSVTFFQRGAVSASIIAVETSDTGASWATIAFITNTYPTATWPWPSFTTPINSPSNLLIRLRASGGGGLGYLDDVSITYPPPSIALSGLTNSPARPIDQDPATISVSVTINGVADTIALTNYWREWPATNWTLTAMTSNGPNLYTNVIPGKSIGALTEYYARATYTADGVTYNTNSSTNAYTVIPKSSNTNLSVTGQVASPLRTGANYQWQGVIQVTNANPTFKFQGISNAVTTTWGDVNQSVTNTPLYGQAEVTTSDITLYTTNTGYYLFSFTETNLDYTVRSCTYENFSTWTAATYNGSSTYTNNNWVLTSGNTSNDIPRIFSGTGRSAIVETNGWVRSPYLSNGVGQISFWYRNWPTNGTPTGKTIVQTSSNAITWTDLSGGTFSNIISTNYLYSSVSANDRASKYVRILNTNSAARLCLDEIAITDPGAGVSAANYSPTNATYLDSIILSADLTPYNGAMISSVTASYRVGPSGAWETASMTNNGTHYALSSPIIGVPVGSLYYVLNCAFTGFQANSPIAFPVGSTNEVTIGNVIDNHYEPLDASSWPYTNSSAASRSFTNTTTGWAIENATLYRNISGASTNFWTSPSNSCILNPSFGPISALKSPIFTNAVGGVTFTSRGSSGFSVAVESSSNGTDWITYRYVTNNTALPWITNSVAFGTISNCQIRIRAAGSAVSGYIDDVRVSYPPANVIITNVYINPGYPVAGQPFTVDCDIISINPNSPAYNITPTFAYWPNGGTASNIVMDRPWVQGTTNHYHAAGSLAAVTRDTLYLYEVRASFDGYYGSVLENQSPKTNAPTGTFTTRAFSSAYSNVAANINGDNTLGRLLTNGLWQSIVSGSSASTNFTLAGLGYSIGSGYDTNAFVFGNSNNWQTTLPMADYASGTNPIPAALTNKQILVRYDEATGLYLIQQCTWQDFDGGEGNGTTYKGTYVGSSAGSSAQQDFNDWPTNTTRVRTEDFEGLPWTTYTNATYTNGVGGGLSWYLYNCKSATAPLQGTVIQTFTNIPNDTYSFIAQGSHFGSNPLRGVGQVSYSYAVPTTNVPVSLGAFLGRTNDYAPPNVGDTEYLGFQTTYWAASPNFMPVNNITNKTFLTNSMVLATNLTLDVIFSHLTGTQSVYYGMVSVGEWYSESQTTDLNGWVSSGYYIETNASGNCCKLDGTRTATPTNQYVRSPIILGGIKYIEFKYTGTHFDGTTNGAISFQVELATNSPSNWTLLDTISTNFSNNTGTNYYTYKRTLESTTPNLYVRIKNTTPRPGALLLDDISIPGNATPEDWAINNVAVHYRDQKSPPASLQYYRGVAYLNNSRTSLGSPAPTVTEFPDTNTYPNVRSPYMPNGIGEISFWYRNAATNSTPTPAKLYVQTAVQLISEADWTNHPAVAIITNVVNTNDYLYFQTSLYDTTSRFVRIYSDDKYTTTVGRVCLDDILVTAPLATSLILSNLVISPTIPIYTNTVDISVDVYRLFYNPIISGMTGYYGTATSYAGLAGASLTALPMTCISTNSSPLGPWYRYQTKAASPIPTLPSDTFVKYIAKATFSGFHTEATSPVTNKTFDSQPAWMAPLDKVNVTTQAFYVVLSSPTGSVWINEINVQDLSDWAYAIPSAKYIELCGPANVNLNGWTFEILTGDGSTQSIYSVTNSFIFTNTANGFGFFVLGNSITSNRNMTITNDLPSEGGVRLLRKSGIYADKVAWALDVSYIPILMGLGFTYAGDEDLLNDASLSLTGTGTLNNAFTWINTAGWSYGGPNAGQLLQGITQDFYTPTNVTILAFSINSTNIWIECSGGTNGWGAAPWYSTNLMNTNGWVLKTPFSSSLTPSNTYQLNFARTNLTPCFYRIAVTNGM